MKKAISIGILLIIATVFIQPVSAEHYVRVKSDTKSIDKKESYKSGHIFKNAIDTTQSFYIHIINGTGTQNNINRGVVDSAKFQVKEYSNDINKVKFYDKKGDKLRFECFNKAEILVKVEEDFLRKDDVDFLSKSEYDSIQKTITVQETDSLSSDSLNVVKIDSDQTNESSNLGISLAWFFGGLTVGILLLLGILFTPLYLKQKKKVAKVEKQNSEADAETPAQPEEETSQDTERVLTWRDKLGIYLAKEIFEGKEARINELEDDKKKQEEEIAGLNGQVEEKDKQLNLDSTQIDTLKSEIKDLKETQLPQSKSDGKNEENKAILEKIKSKFIDLKDVMTIDEALKKIIEAIENYKQKVSEADDNVKQQKNALNSEYEKKKKELEESNSKRRKELDTEFKQKEEFLQKQFDSKIKEVEYQQKVAEKAYNEAKSLSDSAEQRIKEIEASDKGVLTTKLEQIQGELNDSSNQVTTLNTQIDDLNSEINNYKKQISSLQSKLTDEQKAHQKTKETNKTEREQLKVSHKSELKDKEIEYQNRISQLKDEHQNELANINDAHQKELKKKDEDHLSEITQEKQKAEDRETKLKDVISSQKSSISELEEKLQIESDLLRNEAVQIAETLCQFLKDNEIMAACDDDYKDKVEEKLQDVVYEAEQMYQAIKGLPQAKTPSEWVETLTKLLTQQMEENTSLLNRVLKYYAMSNVPFMIDSERGNGIYFIRKHMSQAYDYINSILAQCGIVPIIPAAFVENKDEGHYEVEGQFNDIESFCPGNMSEHLEHVERSSQSQSDMIIGITRVGYIIKNKQIIKAQVITK